MVSEVSCKRTQVRASSKAVRGGGRKGDLAMISYKFSLLLCTDEAKYHWLKNIAPPINFDC